MLQTGQRFSYSSIKLPLGLCRNHLLVSANLFIFAVLFVSRYYFLFCLIMALLQTVLDHCQQCNAHLFSWWRQHDGGTPEQLAVDNANTSQPPHAHTSKMWHCWCHFSQTTLPSVYLSCYPYTAVFLNSTMKCTCSVLANLFAL